MKPGGETAQKLGATMTQRFGNPIGPRLGANDDSDKPNTLANMDPARRVDDSDGSMRKQREPGLKQRSGNPSNGTKTIEDMLKNPKKNNPFWSAAAQKPQQSLQQKQHVPNRNPLKLKSEVASNSSVDLVDSLRVKQGLNKLGYLQEPKFGITRYPNQQMFDAIQDFQKGKGLKIDGVMKPGGETEQTLSKILTDNGLFFKDAHEDELRSSSEALALQQHSSSEALAQQKRSSRDAVAQTNQEASTDAQTVPKPPLKPGEYDRDGDGVADARDKLFRPGDGKSNPQPQPYYPGMDGPDSKMLLDAKTSDTKGGGGPKTGKQNDQPDGADTATDGTPKSGVPEGARMDEHGNWFDADGKPIDDPNQNLNLHKTAGPVAIPAAAAAIGSAAVAAGAITQKQLDAAMAKVRETGKPLTDFLPDLKDTPAGIAATAGLAAQSALKKALGRTDAADPTPPIQGFPANAPKLGSNKEELPQAEPTPGVPPLEPTGANDNTILSTPDQSDDPDLRGGSIVEIKEWDESKHRDINDGGVPADVEKGLAEQPAHIREKLRKIGMADGTITGTAIDGISLDTHRPGSELKTDWEQTIRDFGGDPNDGTVEVDGAATYYKIKDGTMVVRRPSNGNGATLEIQRPVLRDGPKIKGKKNDMFRIKRRYDD